MQQAASQLFCKCPPLLGKPPLSGPHWAQLGRTSNFGCPPLQAYWAVAVACQALELPRTLDATVEFLMAAVDRLLLMRALLFPQVGPTRPGEAAGNPIPDPTVGGDS